MTTTDERQPPSPKSENTISRILDAALDIFARKGYHDTRMDEIVAGSQTSKGSIYFHFPNKEQLFLALVDQFANLLERRITEAISEHDRGMVKVQAALEACLATFGRYRRQAKVLLVKASGLGNTFEQKRLAINDRFAALIALYLQEAVDVGEIAPLDTEVVAQAWMGAIYNLVIRWVYTGEPDSERILQALVPMLLQSVGYQPEQNGQALEEQA
jgi:AcrR family transcriptional regulator